MVKTTAKNIIPKKEETKVEAPTKVEFEKPTPVVIKADTVATLMKKGTVLRVYDKETHGKDFIKLADTYRSHKGGYIILT